MSYSYSNRGFQRYPKLVKVGEEYEADIIDKSHRGDAGIAKIQGFVVFVSDAKPGDHMKFRITRVGNRFATAEIIR